MTEKMPFSAWELELLRAAVVCYREKHGDEFEPHARVHMEQLATRISFADPA